MHSTKQVLLGVNIDHVATLRQARHTLYPDPVQAAIEAEQAGADGITLHMREDLRHIQARDVHLIKAVIQTRMNLELAITNAMLDFACEIKPAHACLVPEKREELTTEGGLDLRKNYALINDAIQQLRAYGSEVSLFIDPDKQQIDLAKALKVSTIEINTGAYAEAKNLEQQQQELTKIQQSSEYAASLQLVVNAGHGLHYHNVKPIAAISVINELNIGHAIVARALFVGLNKAVQTMRQLLQQARIDL